MSDLHDVLGKIVLSKDFRGQLKGAIDNKKVGEFLKAKGYNVDQEHINGIQNLDVDTLNDASVKDLPDQLMSKVGLDPEW